jgi:PhoD-like phosphatase
MPKLVLGPLLRYVGETQATVWVETDTPAEVQVLGGHSPGGARGQSPGGARGHSPGRVLGRAPTFQVERHHYALVLIEGLEPGRGYEYSVSLDGEPVWPQVEGGPAFPPSRIRTLDPDGDEGPLRVAFGSCRVAAPHEPPWTLPVGHGKKGKGADALYAFALRMRTADPDTWPHLLLLLGDQIYADDTSPEVQEFIRSRRDVKRPPGKEVADFEEYTRLYWETWGDPVLRWLLSTVPTAMIFDDHDINDDWNTSAAWVRHMRRQPWWEERITSGLASYWLYQHLGNLSPEDLENDPVWPKVREAGDATRVLREFALRADREIEGTRWSYKRDFGRTRLVVIDSRCGRVLEGNRREMVDDDEWAWIEEQATGDFDHLLLATSLPFVLAPATHHLETWNEALTSGAWGRLAARAAEGIRQTIDLEHWAAFNDSFDRLAGLIEAVTGGRRGQPPGSVVVLSGDVHHTYLAELSFPAAAGGHSPAWQAVCSPLRNPLPATMQAAHRRAFGRPATAVTRWLAQAAKVEPEAVDWRVVEGPWFDNHIGELNLDGRSAMLQVERAVTPDGGHGPPRLEHLYAHRLANGA